MKKTITSPQAPAPIGPYSQGVETDHMIFISGQVAIDASGKLNQTDISIEARQVMLNLQAILNAAGSDFTRVVKTTIFLTDLKNFAAVNEVYGSFFTGNYPARETVQVSALPLGAQVEISMIAVK